ncbi:MAG TPA: hypothetical protein VHO68_08510 [Bacteroidales bacterium]|nr:hypothetical protein [Bacteroidales bacterium]
MNTFLNLNLKWIIRDRILQALAAVSLFLIMLVPAISAFSMRQTQELAVTLSLSFVSFTLLIFALSLGSTIVWRDIERRYTYAVLSLPLDRGGYIVAKFCAVALFLITAAIIIGCCSFIAIFISSFKFPSQIPVQWGMIAVAIFMDTLKYMLLAAIAILVTTISTSFFMPFFTTISIFMAGSASQEVFEFVTSEAGTKLGGGVRLATRVVYYIIPIFSAFNFKLQAVYPIPFDTKQISYAVIYFLVYTALTLSAAVWIFSRRELT